MKWLAYWFWYALTIVRVIVLDSTRKFDGENK